ncbi:MAG: alpha/beta hydrolase [Anaerolineae bacterium]|jgi:pimeloyl-ACP methyl ester carboxylesterase|nr:alpha/beta hydrolase [Anaerolineae bacterium]
MELIPLIVVSLLLFLTVAFVWRYRDEQNRQRAQLDKHSRILKTPLGSIQFVIFGEGKPILIAYGGYDQGLIAAQPLLAQGFRVIAVSRPGALNTPSTPMMTPEQEADLYDALLDEIALPQVAIIGLGTAGPAALQFALRHPERCWALILASSVNQFYREPQVIRWRRALSLRAPGLIWLMAKFAPLRLLKPYGPLGDGPNLTILRGLLGAEHLAARQTMIAYEGAQIAALANWNALLLEQIHVPTLVIHGDDDPIVPYAIGQFAAQRIPHAQMLTVPHAGHLAMVTHWGRIEREVLRFLTERSATR